MQTSDFSRAKVGAFCAVFAAVLCAPMSAAEEHALKNAVILIVRHAEKPETGTELSPEGKKRADTYANYFTHLTLDGKAVKLDALFSTADSTHSHRPRLTLEPLAKESGLKIDDRYKNQQVRELAAELLTKSHGKHLLICWHHGEIANLVRALGAEPDTLLPEGKWPNSQFAWVLELGFDHEGKFIPGAAKRIEEGF